MFVESTYLISLVFFVVGLLSVFLTRNNCILTNRIAHGCSIAGSLAATLCAISILSTGGVSFVAFHWLAFGDVTIRLDNMAAYFVLLIGIAGLAASFYAVGYSQEYFGARYEQLAFLWNLFLLSMVLVVTVSHVAAFLVAWEVMAVVSCLLVNHESEKAENNRAAFIYLVMTHIGTAFIIVAFMLLATAADSLDFANLSAAPLSATTRNIVFLCALIGFGAKAGVIPLHIWLPQAHPAAPSHVSALMSGVMLKTAIYGLCRFYLEFLGTGPAWWGIVVLIVGAISALLGILYALMEKDLKRLLAYSSVENIGIILLGMGAGVFFMNSGRPELAGLAWTAALFHAFNHALFKPLLFLGAGAVLHSTHTKNLEQLGGLIRRMPYTSILFLIGCAAISALPLLNGFISEWLTLKSLFYLSKTGGLAAKLGGTMLVAVLGLTGALAAACFVKAFGVGFLGLPRSHQAERATEVPPVMTISMALLAAACIGIGLWPQPLLLAVRSLLAGYRNVVVTSIGQAQLFSFTMQVNETSSVSIPAFVLITLAGLLLAGILYRLYGQPLVARGETWTCGIVPTSRMAYTATGFSKPVRTAFRSILRPQRETVATAGGRYFGRRLTYRVNIRFLISELLYRPLNEYIMKSARYLKRLQAGSVQLYVGYIMIVTVGVLLWSAGW